jgi:hypothetical protein
LRVVDIGSDTGRGRCGTGIAHYEPNSKNERISTREGKMMSGLQRRRARGAGVFQCTCGFRNGWKQYAGNKCLVSPMAPECLDHLIVLLQTKDGQYMVWRAPPQRHGLGFAETPPSCR